MQGGGGDGGGGGPAALGPDRSGPGKCGCGPAAGELDFCREAELNHLVIEHGVSGDRMTSASGRTGEAPGGASKAAFSTASVPRVPFLLLGRTFAL